MSEKVVQITPDYWNIRGVFKIALLDIGTHCSIVRRTNGNLVFLDYYSMHGKLKAEVDNICKDQEVEAIINVHPFHTIHVEKAHEQFPQAKLYGTKRHHEKFPALPWEKELTESEQFAALFEEDFDFSVPRGVDFISKNDKIHFSSVLVYHRSSRTIHVDDTFMFGEIPLVRSEISFHPTLPFALQKAPGAAKAFRTWAQELAEQWKEAENLCAAHSDILLDQDPGSRSISTRILEALDKVESTLQRHERRYD